MFFRAKIELPNRRKGEERRCVRVNREEQAKKPPPPQSKLGRTQKKKGELGGGKRLY